MSSHGTVSFARSNESAPPGNGLETTILTSLKSRRQTTRSVIALEIGLEACVMRIWPPLAHPVAEQLEVADLPREAHLDLMVDMPDAGKLTAGVVVGKFNPPHLGHVHLIERGAAQVDRLFVLLCDREDQTISVTQRLRWLQDVVPANVTIVVTPDDLPAANEPWAYRTLEVMPLPPDIAFTSETWGSGWAELMGARHVLVDVERVTVPISGTRLRADLRESFHMLVPQARAELARRVVVIGAESTGKTTLAEALAREVGTVWVPEHGRWYWEGRRHLPDQSWSSDEFRRIAKAQRRLEDDLARKANCGLVVADTDALVTSAWHERYLGHADAILDDLSANAVPDMYLVCSPDFDWVQDGTRESRDHRQTMHESMVRRAEASGADVAFVSGPHDARVSKALALVQSLTQYTPLI